MIRRPACFALPVLDKWLVYLPLHRVSALLTQSGMRELLDPDTDTADTELRRLKEDLAAEPPEVPLPKQGVFDPGLLAIVTTRGCNINCLYCDFGGPTSEKVHMDPTMAVTAIDWMADTLRQCGREQFSLHLFGGEPLSSGDLVDIIIHRFRSVCAEKSLRPFIDVSTNGVMTLDRARWVGDYLDSVVLSFDGPPDLQNHTRPGNGGRSTFDIVDRTARYLSSTSIQLCLRVCVTAESVSRMPAITRWMTETYHPAIINFEPLTENDLTTGSGLQAPDPYEYARHWIASKRLAESYGVRVVYSATESDAPRLSSCPVGSDAVVITPDGQVNGCYLQPTDWHRRGMEMNLGKISAAHGVEIRPERAQHLRQLVVDKPRCRNCLCQWACAGGCHVSNTYAHCSNSYVDFCIQTRLITSCLILEELNQTELVDRLLSDPDAMRRLAYHSSDTIDMWPRADPASGKDRTDADA